MCLDQIRVSKKQRLFQFSSERSVSNRTWIPIWWLQVLLIAKRSDENFKSLCFFLTSLVLLLQDPFWPYGLTLIRCYFETEAREPKQNTFSESWVRKDFVVTSPEKFSRWKFSGTERVNKNSLLYQFPCTDGKKSIKAVCAKCCWCYRISTYPSWTVGSQTFLGFHWSLPDVNSLGSRAFQC